MGGQTDGWTDRQQTVASVPPSTRHGQGNSYMFLIKEDATLLLVSYFTTYCNHQFWKFRIYTLVSKFALGLDYVVIRVEGNFIISS